MKKLLPMLLLLLIAASAMAQAKAAVETPTAPADFASKLKATITHYLGRPYVWGSSGLKSFDCSGFLWRVMWENGILTKRTTARKFYMMLPPIEESSESSKWKFGTVVFFNDLEHVGIVASPTTFYHAATSKGTSMAQFDPLWRGKIYGFRSLPAIDK